MTGAPPLHRSLRLAQSEPGVDLLAFEDLLERLRGLLDRVLGEECRCVGDQLGRREDLTESTIRTIVLRGNRSLCVGPVVADERPGGRAVTAVGDAARSRNGAFCVLHVGPIANSHVDARAPRRRTRPARTGGGAVPAAWTPRGIGRASDGRSSASPVAATTEVAADDQFGIDGGRVDAGGVEPLAAALLHADVGAEHADRPTSRPRSLLVRSPSSATGVAERVERRQRRARGRTRWKASRRSPSSSRRPQPPQPDRDRLPDGVVPLGLERLERMRAARAPTFGRRGGRPGVVDEVVALERRQRRDRAGVEPGAQVVAVGDAEEAVAAGVDHDGCPRASPSSGIEAGVAVEQHRRRVVAVRTWIGIAQRCGRCPAPRTRHRHRRNRSGVGATRVVAVDDASAITSGKPGCQIHESMIRRTGSPDWSPRSRPTGRWSRCSRSSASAGSG